MLRRTPGAQSMNDFPKEIQIRWKLDFKCNFIVSIISLQNFAQLSYHVENFVTIISPKLGWEQHEISEMWNELQLHRLMLVLVFGMGLHQIIAVRKYFVDKMRNYAIRLLTSPDIMCKCNLIKPLNKNKHCGNICTYYVRYNQKLLVSRNFQAPLS